MWVTVSGLEILAQSDQLIVQQKVCHTLYTAKGAMYVPSAIVHAIAQCCRLITALCKSQEQCNAALHSKPVSTFGEL